MGNVFFNVNGVTSHLNANLICKIVKDFPSVNWNNFILSFSNVLSLKRKLFVSIRHLQNEIRIKELGKKLDFLYSFPISYFYNWSEIIDWGLCTYKYIPHNPQ